MKILNGEAILGDCLEEMKKLNDCSIDLTVTSPPYDNIRIYKGNLSWDFEGIAKELFRITKNGGIVVWVVGDQTKEFNESGTSFKQALFFKEIGFNLLDTMIKLAINYAPGYPGMKRYSNQFEYMFVLSKGKPKTFNPVLVPKQYHRKGVASFRKEDGTKTHKYIYNEKTTKQASNVWGYPSGNLSIGHPAVFQEKLANDHILSWSNEGDIVLDCFGGSFTTAVAAEKLKRKWIMIEKEPEYFDIGINRLNSLQK